MAAMRRLGMERILYGSDGAAGGNLPPREAWAAFRQLPLTSEEFRAIARNVARISAEVPSVPMGERVVALWRGIDSSGIHRQCGVTHNQSAEIPRCVDALAGAGR